MSWSRSSWQHTRLPSVLCPLLHLPTTSVAASKRLHSHVKEPLGAPWLPSQHSPLRQTRPPPKPPYEDYTPQSMPSYLPGSRLLHHFCLWLYSALKLPQLFTASVVFLAQV